MGRSGNSKKIVSSSTTKNRSRLALAQQQLEEEREKEERERFESLSNLSSFVLSSVPEDSSGEKDLYFNLLSDTSFYGRPGYYNEQGEFVYLSNLVGDQHSSLTEAIEEFTKANPNTPIVFEGDGFINRNEQDLADTVLTHLMSGDIQGAYRILDEKTDLDEDSKKSFISSATKEIEEIIQSEIDTASIVKEINNNIDDDEYFYDEVFKDDYGNQIHLSRYLQDKYNLPQLLSDEEVGFIEEVAEDMGVDVDSVRRKVNQGYDFRYDGQGRNLEDNDLLDDVIGERDIELAEKLISAAGGEDEMDQHLVDEIIKKHGMKNIINSYLKDYPEEAKAIKQKRIGKLLKDEDFVAELTNVTTECLHEETQGRPQINRILPYQAEMASGAVNVSAGQLLPKNSHNKDESGDSNLDVYQIGNEIHMPRREFDLPGGGDLTLETKHTEDGALYVGSGSATGSQENKVVVKASVARNPDSQGNKVVRAVVEGGSGTSTPLTPSEEDISAAGGLDSWVAQQVELEVEKIKEAQRLQSEKEKKESERQAKEEKKSQQDPTKQAERLIS